ncbi:hypothetical protein Tco_0979758 [Tanacetum coccineum]
MRLFMLWMFPEMGIGPLGDGIEFDDQEAVLETVAKNYTRKDEYEGTETLTEKQLLRRTAPKHKPAALPECNEVENVVEDKDTCHVPDALKQVENNTYIFYYHIGKGAKPGDPDFNLDASFKSTT